MPTPKLDTKTDLSKRTRAARTRAARTRATRHHAHAARPQLARVRQAVNDLAGAVLDLANESALASERPSIRRVRRALLSRSRTAPDFADMATTAEALIRVFEDQAGPMDPRLSQALALEIARTFSAQIAPIPTTARAARATCPRWPSDPAAYRFA
jgi:hypothetical protein